MGENTEISWSDATFNPWEGCCKVSPGCDGCYAEARDNRLHHGDNWGKDAFRLAHKQSYWKQPVKWNAAAQASGIRKRVFCGSLCDVMEDRRDLDPIRDRLYELIVATPHIDWLLLTKRPQNYIRLLPGTWTSYEMPSNVWCGTTVENAYYLWRIKALKAIPAIILWLSIEPLLGPIPTLREHLDSINWVIVGGESGPAARPMHPDWVRDIRNQCIAAGVPFHFKQFGEWAPFHSGPISDLGRGQLETGGGHRLIDVGGYTMARVGKKAAGAMLDGREWRQFPEVRS